VGAYSSAVSGNAFRSSWSSPSIDCHSWASSAASGQHRGAVTGLAGGRVLQLALELRLQQVVPGEVGGFDRRVGDEVQVVARQGDVLAFGVLVRGRDRGGVDTAVLQQPSAFRLLVYQLPTPSAEYTVMVLPSPLSAPVPRRPR
jgi:hypothetical protein